MSQEEKQVLGSFKYGNGKPVAVSRDNLTKATHLMKEITAEGDLVAGKRKAEPSRTPKKHKHDDEDIEWSDCEAELSTMLENSIREPTAVGSSSDLPSRNAFNISTQSYDDLHSINDYCWRLLSDQIETLQRCLPKGKGLSSEDEIFVALAQLKKVRDVLKESLRLKDELEATNPGGGSKC